MSPIFSSLFGGLLDHELGNVDSTLLFTTARRKAAVNKGLHEFADLTECYVRTSTWTLTADGSFREYDLSTLITSTDFVRLAARGVWITHTDNSSVQTILEGDRDLPRRDVEWLNRFEPGWQLSTVASSAASVLPDAYYLRSEGGQLLLGFWPSPSSGSSGSMTASLAYVAQPQLMTSDTQEPFQSTTQTVYRFDLRPYHQALVHYAAHQLEKLRRDDVASDRHLQKFLGYVARYLGSTKRKIDATVWYATNYFQVRGRDRGLDPRR